MAAVPDQEGRDMAEHDVMEDVDPMVRRSYEDAVNLLNTTQSGFKAVGARTYTAVRERDDLILMEKWLGYIGYSPADINRLNVIHVAGTKGKGTTCAFVNAILQRYHDTGQPPRKIGLYTSPHLVSVRERIRINSEPLSEELFARYFFEVWLAFEEGVDVAIYEVGVGGEFDSTNIVPKPLAVAITTLGIDHQTNLGDTIEQIAWHKAGIMKTAVKAGAFTVDQVPAAMEVLKQRAEEKGVALTVLRGSPAVDKIRLRPNEDFQKKNAQLAVELAYAALSHLNVHVQNEPEQLPDEFVYGLENVTWRGRCEVKITGNQEWCLDGAHNEPSLQVASRWFSKLERESPMESILLFNQQSTRAATPLLETIHQVLCKENGVKFSRAVFCAGVTYKDMTFKPDFVNRNIDPKALASLEAQHIFANAWHRLEPGSEVDVLPSIQHAIDRIREVIGDRHVRVLVTGSFHLVGALCASWREARALPWPARRGRDSRTS
ncbi:unnamed protein product [Parascedosporium putredinis]|uniref:Folylpolyglutamate synthase n=1 Tax=Parascedosporium putredinis TaxID=1442378 RepID=A0A9P1GX32_9PEZI|nr:unnamed protein product [Parascedosporium putredinis]CAI7990180.1 unnamed protein product [Parascedosporium putredinis]